MLALVFSYASKKYAHIYHNDRKIFAAFFDFILNWNMIVMCKPHALLF